MKPLKFTPLLKQVIWGGDKIVPFKGIGSGLDRVGESWEISGVAGSETVVCDGEYKGMRLNDVVRAMKGALLGEENYRRFGDEFPLLVKFIDAHRDLSIQVHPDDETARRHGKGHGKTEMWYIMESDKGARLYNGLNREITLDEYERLVADDAICSVLAQYTVKEGDAFFIPAGRIHAIGTGCFLVEIQQTSDVTYRIFDYNRKDADGKTRELHTMEAAECIDCKMHDDCKVEYSGRKNEGATIVACQHFTTSVYDLDEPMTLDYSELDSFVILTGLKGDGAVTDGEGNETTLRAGETILVPATTERINVSGTIRFLETFV